jgi:uncharacterized phage protein (TIGR02218 family)
MKTVTGTFPTWATSVLLADLWTFTMQNGTVYRWTSWESTLSWSGNTWIGGAGAPIIQRNSTKLIAGLEVDSLELTVQTGDSVMLGSRNFTQAAAAKVFDGCVIRLERAYMVIPGTVQCSVFVFEGTVNEVVPSHSEVGIKVNSFLERLNQDWPRNCWSPACQHKLFSAGCGISEFSFQQSVAGNGSQTQFTASHLKPNDFFTLGKATFVGGLNDGLSMGIKQQIADTFILVGKLPAAVSGTVIIVPGCDKTQATCSSKYANLGRFKGFPYIPRPETAR